MIAFAGWHMPLAYPKGAVEEHRATRRCAGLFDISHMGRIRVTGESASVFLNRLISSDISGLDTGMSTYGLLCKPDGGILDDVFVFRLDRSRFVVVVNAANTAKALAWFQEHNDEGVGLRDFTEETSMFALQGPRALETLSSVAGYDGRRLPRFGVSEEKIGSARWQISRTGYTGEEGVELVVPAVDSLAAWSALARVDTVTPVGLAARDSLRFEPGFALYGHEIGESRTPVEARLTWACDFSYDFIGRDAIRKVKRDGVSKKLVTFRMTHKGVPREGCRVLDDDGAPIGEVVTGMYAPTVDAFAGNAYVGLEYSKIGSTIGVEIRDRLVPAEVVKRPLYRPAYRE